MLAQSDIISLGSDPKTWLVLIGGMVLSMVVGRFIQAFRNGAGIRDAALSVWLGTNVPKNMKDAASAIDKNSQPPQAS